MSQRPPLSEVTEKAALYAQHCLVVAPASRTKTKGLDVLSNKGGVWNKQG